MANIQSFNEAVNIISQLTDYPNQEDGLTPDELKAKFDEAARLIKEYLNDVIVPAINELDTESGDHSKELIEQQASLANALDSLEKITKGLRAGDVVTSDNKFDNVFDMEGYYIDSTSGNLVAGGAQPSDYVYPVASSKFYELGELPDGCVYSYHSGWEATYDRQFVPYGVALYDGNFEFLRHDGFDMCEGPYKMKTECPDAKYFRVVADQKVEGSVYVSGVEFTNDSSYEYSVEYRVTAINEILSFLKTMEDEVKAIQEQSGKIYLFPVNGSPASGFYLENTTYANLKNLYDNKRHIALYLNYGFGAKQFHCSGLHEKDGVIGLAFQFCFGDESEWLFVSTNKLVQYGTARTNSVGQKSASGGEIFGDYENNEAGELAAAFGEKSKAKGRAAFAAGAKKDRSGAPDEPAESDWRYNEAIGEGSAAIGMGAVAYSRASKSLGYRTQTGYPPSKEELDKRPEAITQTDADGNVTFPGDNVGQAAVAIGADTAALANHSFAGGYGTKASGQNSFAIGKGTQASGEQSFAGGVNSTASARNAFAFGQSNISNAIHTVTMNRGNKAEGIASAVFGDYNVSPSTASKSGQMVIGRYNDYVNGAIDDALFVVGNGTSATERKNALVVRLDGSAELQGKFSVSNAEVSGQLTAKSVAIGNKASVQDNGSLSVGYSTVASGEYAVAEGYSTEASGIHSHAAGHGTKAKGSHAFTTGYDTEARAKFSSTFGYGTHTAEADPANKNDNTGIAQMVVGLPNAYENGEIDDAVFVVGIGDKTANIRRNGFVVRKDGSAEVSGELKAGSIAPATAASMVRTEQVESLVSGDELRMETDGDFNGQIGVLTDNTSVRIYIWFKNAGWLQLTEWYG